jgi:ferredoxin
MPLNDFKARSPLNPPGKYYSNTLECNDCGLCRKRAPSNFARDDKHCVMYVCRQPATRSEDLDMRNAMQACCADSIYEDGEKYDWASVPAQPFYIRKTA